MKRQYRYKTAANTNFFPKPLFKPLDDALKDMNEVIIKMNPDSMAMRSWKNLTNQKENIDRAGVEIARHVDAAIFTSKCDEELMDMISRYEEWYKKSYDFLNQDDFKEINKSIDVVDTIAATASEWSSGGANCIRVHELLNNMIANASAVQTGSVTTDAQASAFVSGAISNADFSSSVEKLLQQMNAIVNTIDNPNENYMGGITDPSNVIKVKTSSVMEELVAMRSAHQEEKRKKRTQKNVMTDQDVYDKVSRRIKTFDLIMRSLIPEFCDATVYNGLQATVAGTTGAGIAGITGAADWSARMDTELNNLKTMVDTRFAHIQDLINNGTLLSTIGNMESDINHLFSDATGNPILSGTIITGVSDSKKYILQNVSLSTSGPIGTLEELKDMIIDGFKELHKELKDRMG